MSDTISIAYQKGRVTKEEGAVRRIERETPRTERNIERQGAEGIKRRGISVVADASMALSMTVAVNGE